jgi:hypothetical protein
MRALLIPLLMVFRGAAQDDWDKVVLLQKVKRHIAEGVKRLPDYTCLQTAARYRTKAGVREQERLVDTVVLEVLNAGAKELYAPPGARSFDAENPVQLAAGGLTGTGTFGLFLNTLFVNDSATFQFRGDGQFHGKRTLRWDYRVPRMMSGFSIHLEYSRAVVGMRGTIMVDPETLDLVYLSVLADEVPPNLPLASATQILEYGTARIGERDVMLPQTASIKLIEESGATSRNVIEFTHCQSFRVESKVSFGATDEAASKTAAPEEARALATGLTVGIELAQAVTDKMTVGTLIEGRVTEAVKEKRKTVIAAGSAVRGRVRRLERVDDETWAVGLEFTEIETETGTQRFYANLTDIDKGVVEVLKIAVPGTKGKAVDSQWLPYLPGVAQFFVTRREVNLPRGFRTVWKTTSARTTERTEPAPPPTIPTRVLTQGTGVGGK